MEPTVDASGAGGGNVGAGGNAGSPGTAGTPSAGGSSGVADGGGSAGKGGAAGGVGGMGGKGVGGMGGNGDAAVGPDGSGGGAAGAAGMAGSGGAGGTGGPGDGGAGAHIDASSGAGGSAGVGQDAGREPHTVRCGSVTCDLRAGEYCCLDATPSCVGAQQGPGPVQSRSPLLAARARIDCTVMIRATAAAARFAARFKAELGSVGDATCTRAGQLRSVTRYRSSAIQQTPMRARTPRSVARPTNVDLQRLRLLSPPVRPLVRRLQ